MIMRIYSTAFLEGGEIPIKNTQEAEDLSPELVFEDIPSETKSLVLISDDPDAPDPQAPKLLWLHWLVVNLPATCTGLAEGIKTLPSPAIAGVNDCDEQGWSGPRPPIGVHRYYFHLYALDKTLDVKPGFRRADVEAAMQGHVIAEAQTFGTYILTSNR